MRTPTAAAAAAHVPASEEEADVYREMELDRQISGTVHRWHRCM